MFGLTHPHSKDIVLSSALHDLHGVDGTCNVVLTLFIFLYEGGIAIIVLSNLVCSKNIHQKTSAAVCNKPLTRFTICNRVDLIKDKFGSRRLFLVERWFRFDHFSRRVFMVTLVGRSIQQVSRARRLLRGGG